MVERAAGRMFWIAYDTSLYSVTPFESEIDCLRFALKHEISAKRVKWGVELREQVYGDEIVDAEIVDWPEQVAALESQRLTALEIHHPCHTAETEPWICGRHSDPEHDGYYRNPAVCVDCVDGDENAITYPCPTAQALGVTTWLAAIT